MCNVAYLKDVRSAKADYDESIQILEDKGWNVSRASSISMNHPAHTGIGMQSILFEREITTDDGSKTMEYAYAFAGTNSLEDGVEDFTQLFLGISPQISKTIENVSQLSKELDGKEITFVGHSFGAVPATVGSIMTGQKAITFNPAHLGGLSQLFHGLDIGKANVTNYISSMGNIISDPVTHLQNSGSWLLGNKIIGSQINVPVNGFSHSIQDICNALKPK